MSMHFQDTAEQSKRLRAQVQEDMTLPIGEPITVYSGEDRKLEGKIVGYEQSNFIILRLQGGQKGGDSGMGQGSKINAHFVQNDFTVVAFLSTLLAKINLESSSIVFCRYPQRFITSTKRIGTRVDCLLPVTVKIDGRLALGVITNVSFKGCQLTFDSQTGKYLKDLAENQTISIHLNPFQANAPGRDVSCSIKYILRGQSGIKFGVTFLNIGSNAMSTIREYINEQQTKAVMNALHSVEMKAGEGLSQEEISKAAEKAALMLTKKEEHSILAGRYSASLVSPNERQALMSGPQ